MKMFKCLYNYVRMILIGTFYKVFIAFLTVKSRVLMSLRGEQDDLNWYDIYGPNVPYAELDKQDQSVGDMPTSYVKEVLNMKPDSTNEKATVPTSEVTDKPTTQAGSTQVISAKVKQVVEVTVDGRFGHANHSRDEAMKTVVGKGLNPDIKVEGLVESADAI